MVLGLKKYHAVHKAGWAEYKSPQRTGVENTMNEINLDSKIKK